MLEVSMFDETFTIYTECIDKLTVRNILSILYEFNLYCESKPYSINARGSFEDMYEALHKLSSEYHLFIS